MSLAVRQDRALQGMKRRRRGLNTMVTAHGSQCGRAIKSKGIGMIMRTVVVVGTLLLGLGAVVAQQDAVKLAQDQMKGNGKNAGALAAMVKGEKPYDQATVDAALAQFEDTVKKFPTLFPASMKGLKAEGDYSASPKIWEDKAGFSEHIASFGKAVTDAKASVKDLDTLKVALPAIGKQCGGCHEIFRVKNG
jgi:cytochrome c556